MLQPSSLSVGVVAVPVHVQDPRKTTRGSAPAQCRAATSPLRTEVGWRHSFGANPLLLPLSAFYAIRFPRHLLTCNYQCTRQFQTCKDPRPRNSPKLTPVHGCQRLRLRSCLAYPICREFGTDSGSYGHPLYQDAPGQSLVAMFRDTVDARRKKGKEGRG